MKSTVGFLCNSSDNKYFFIISRGFIKCKSAQKSSSWSKQSEMSEDQWRNRMWKVKSWETWTSQDQMKNKKKFDGA